MASTSAADLLTRADRLTRTLRDTHPVITIPQWETFDVTLHRLLHELIGTDAHHIPHHDPDEALLKDAARSYPLPLRPPADEYLSPAQTARMTGTNLRKVYRDIDAGHLLAIREGENLYVRTPQLDRRPDIHPADPADPHPLARLSVTLGALADLLHDAHTRQTPVLTRPGQTAHAVTHVVSLGMVAAAAALDTMPHRDADRPFRVAQYGEHVLAGLAARHDQHRPPDLHHLVADVPARIDTPAGRLHDALYHWRRAIQDDLQAPVPNGDTLRVLAQQCAHLIAATLTVHDAYPHQATPAATDALRDAGRALQAAGAPWKHLTTLNQPSHAFISASTRLAATLEHTLVALPDLNPDEVRQTLQAARDGIGHAAALMDQTVTLPDRLARSGLLFAPARRVAHNPTHLAAINRGGYVAVQPTDTPNLDRTWRLAASTLDWAIVADRLTAPVPEAAHRESIAVSR